MTHVRKKIYDRIVAQAEEARDRGFDELSEFAFKSVGSFPEEEYVYQKDEMENEVQTNLWKSAIEIIKYYDIVNADIGKINAIIKKCSEDLEKELKTSFDVKNQLGPFEEKVFGQK